MLLQQRFRDAVLARLEVLGWSKAELGRQMGVSPQYINSYLNENKSPGLDVLERFAQSLGVEAASLISENQQSTTRRERQLS